MKIIGVDNYNRESVADILVAENVNPNYINNIVEFLNERAGQYGARFYRYVDDDYRLSRGMEDLV